MISNMLKMDKVLVVTNYQTEKSLSLHRNEITQVILNILKNSYDNFKEEKTLHPKIEITTKEEDGNFFIEIIDNGGGIDNKILEKIFDPYFSTKNPKYGMGLGLYMSKMIIEEHHSGVLNATNNKHGVCFNINFKN